jgi:hypothetical protein
MSTYFQAHLSKLRTEGVKATKMNITVEIIDNISCLVANIPVSLPPRLPVDIGDSSMHRVDCRPRQLRPALSMVLILAQKGSDSRPASGYAPCIDAFTKYNHSTYKTR